MSKLAIVNSPSHAYLTIGTTGYPFPTLPVNISVLTETHAKAMGAGYRYSLGAKPGADNLPSRIGPSDCSGYVGYLLANTVPISMKAALAREVIARGTYTLSDWFKKCGFKKSTVDSCKLHDGALRVAVMLAIPGIPVGHIALVLNGQTIECHGGKGIDSRPWTGQAWQGRCTVYVLTPPVALPSKPA